MQATGGTGTRCPKGLPVIFYWAIVGSDIQYTSISGSYAAAPNVIGNLRSSDCTSQSNSSPVLTSDSAYK
jgi:hypothetical protein